MSEKITDLLTKIVEIIGHDIEKLGAVSADGIEPSDARKLELYSKTLISINKKNDTTTKTEEEFLASLSDEELIALAAEELEKAKPTKGRAARKKKVVSK